MKLTKADIVNAVQSKLGLPKNKSTDMVESLIEIMKKCGVYGFLSVGSIGGCGLRSNT